VPLCAGPSVTRVAFLWEVKQVASSALDQREKWTRRGIAPAPGPPGVVSMRRLVNRGGNDGRGNDAGGDSSENIVAIDRPPLIAMRRRL
jgi:hypothetical protein